MRTVALSLLLAAFASAQSPSETRLRGVLLERDPDAAGEFAVRAADFHVHRFRFDQKTVVRREEQNIDVPRLRPGDQVEVISEMTPDDPLRYARTVEVTLPVPHTTAKRPPKPTFLRAYTEQEDRMLPRADLAFSGVVVRIDAERLVLRIRSGAEQTIMLRKDTRYTENGEAVAHASVKPTMRVFVRGAKNLYGDVEGYQVAWGHILEVH